MHVIRIDHPRPFPIAFVLVAKLALRIARWGGGRNIRGMTHVDVALATKLQPYGSQCLASLRVRLWGVKARRRPKAVIT